MSLKHATLIALMENGATGYELAKWFDEGLVYFWQASHQQIYAELAKMCTLGFITFKEQKQKGKPTKKIYSLCKAGKEELFDWMLRPTARPVYKDALLMKVFAGNLIPPERLLKEIKNYRDSYMESQAELEKINATVFKNLEQLPLNHQYMHLTLRNGMLQNNALLQWTEEVIVFLEKQISLELS